MHPRLAIGWILAVSSAVFGFAYSERFALRRYLDTSMAALAMYGLLLATAAAVAFALVGFVGWRGEGDVPDAHVVENRS